MARPKLTLIQDTKSYINFSSGTTLQDTIDGIDAQLGSSSPWTESGGKVRLATTTNEIELPNGTAGTPILSYTSEPTTGIYRLSAGNYAFSCLGNLVASFNATDLGLRMYSAGSSVNYTSLVSQSSSQFNTFGSHSSTTEFIIGRVATASQTAHGVCILRAGGAIAGGRTNSNASQLRFEVGQATGDGNAADMSFYTYSGGGASGTAIRGVEQTLLLEGSTFDIVNYSGINNSRWRVESSTVFNLTSGNASTSELLVGQIGTATQSAHPNVTIRAAGAIASGRTNSNGVDLRLEVGQATGDGSDADILFYTYEGGGASGTAIRGTTLTLTLEGSTGDLVNRSVGGDTSRWRSSSASTMNLFTDNISTTELLIGKIGNAAEAPQGAVVIKAGGMIDTGVRADQDAIGLTIEVGQATGSGAAADIDFYTYQGGNVSASALRGTSRAVVFEGETSYIYNYNVNATDFSVWNTESSTEVNLYSNNAAQMNLILGKIGTSSQSPQTVVSLRASGVINSGEITDQNAVGLKIEVGQASGAGDGADLEFYTYSGGGGAGTTIRSVELHTTMYGNGTFAISDTSSLSFTGLDGNLLAIKAVSSAPTASPSSHGGLFIESNDLKYIAPDDTVSSLTGVWDRSGSTVSFTNSGDFLHLNGTGAQLGIGVSSGPSGGTGGSSAIVFADKGADFTTGVASSLAVFANGSDLKTIDSSDVVRTLLTETTGAIIEVGSYTGNGSDPQTVNLADSSLIPKTIIVYGDPGAASPVDGQSANVAMKQGSTMSVAWIDNAGSPSILMEDAAISSSTTGSFDVGGSMNVSSTGYSYMVIGTK